MNDEVQFDLGTPRSAQGKRYESKFVLWTIKYSRGFIKDEEQANYFLVLISVIMITASVIIFMGGMESQPQPPTAEEIRMMEASMVDSGIR